jgi:ribonuclease HI
MAKRSIFFFDGGCRPNPGPMEIAVVSHGRTYFRDDLGSGDNNQAEWLALLLAVELAVAESACDALFIGDSVLIVQQARGAWPCRSPQLRPYIEAFGREASVLPRFHVRHVRRSRNLAGIALERRRLF